MKKVLDYLPTLKIRHVGILELDDFYRWLKRWLKFRGYWASENNETLYSEEIHGEGSKLIEIKWETQKMQSSHVVGKINIEFVLVGVSTQKIPIEGAEVKVYKGDFELRINITVERVGEYKGLMGTMRRWYDDVINKSSTDGYISEVFEDGVALTSEIKQVFNQYA